MRRSDWAAVLSAVSEAALEHLDSLSDRRVQPPADPEPIRARFGGELPEHGESPDAVVRDLATGLAPYLAANSSGRYFGFVIGGLHPAGLGADMLTSTWDQNAGLHAVGPGVAVVEETAARWLLDLLRLPTSASVGFVTGGQMATFTCLAAARHHVLREWSGWDVEADGLIGAPEIHVVVKSEKHGTVPRALRYLGLGGSRVVEVASDDQARMDMASLKGALSRLSGPTLLCVEAGNVNTGSFDPFPAIEGLVAEHRARGNPTWVHVDGAVGLWSRAVDDRLTTGIDRMDSWSTDAHKLLNVPYDSGIAICAHPAPHRAAMGVRAAYLVQGSGEVRDQMDWNPEFSRRARGLPVYAVLRSLGRAGVVEVVEQACALAAEFAARISASGLAEVVNDVVFNQALVRWLHPEGDHDALTERVMARVRDGGVAYFSPTTWEGMRLMRISVSDWATDTEDIERAVTALLDAAAAG